MLGVHRPYTVSDVFIHRLSCQETTAAIVEMGWWTWAVPVEPAILDSAEDLERRSATWMRTIWRSDSQVSTRLCLRRLLRTRQLSLLRDGDIHVDPLLGTYTTLGTGASACPPVMSADLVPRMPCPSRLSSQADCQGDRLRRGPERGRTDPTRPCPRSCHADKVEASPILHAVPAYSRPGPYADATVYPPWTR